MTKLWPAMRVILGFALVVISIILVSDMLGMIQDPGKAQLEGRQKLA